MSAPVTPRDDIDVMRGGSDCEDDDEHVEEDEPTEALLQARKRTMLRFGMAGAGGRARRNMLPHAATLASSEVASQPANLSGFDFTEMRRGLLAGNRATQSSRMRRELACNHCSLTTALSSLLALQSIQQHLTSLRSPHTSCIPHTASDRTQTIQAQK
jgi:hypothetical protein